MVVVGAGGYVVVVAVVGVFDGNAGVVVVAVVVGYVELGGSE